MRHCAGTKRTYCESSGSSTRISRGKDISHESYNKSLTLFKVGAGIQIPSNSSRLLHSWGLDPFLEAHVVEPNGMAFRRWDTGSIIGYTKLVPEFRENFKAPYYVVHRAHFHNALYRRALEIGVDVKIASKVEKYDLECPSVELANGVVMDADLIVAADGEFAGFATFEWNVLMAK